MKRKPSKFPNVRFLINEWFVHVREYNVNAGNLAVMKDINRLKRLALAELRGK